MWPTTEEQVSTFSSMLDEARREQEEETDKRKRMRLCSRFGNPDEWTDRQRDFFQRHPQLLERHRELTISFRVHQEPGPGPRTFCWSSSWAAAQCAAWTRVIW